MTWERVEAWAGRLEWAPKLAYWGQRGVLCHSGEEAGEKGEPAALGCPWLLGLLPSTSAWGELPGEPAKGRATTFTCKGPSSSLPAYVNKDGELSCLLIHDHCFLARLSGSIMSSKFANKPRSLQTPSRLLVLCACCWVACCLQCTYLVYLYKSGWQSSEEVYVWC